MKTNESGAFTGVETANNDRKLQVGNDPTADKKVTEVEAAADSQQVRVRALRTFHKDGDVSGAGELVRPNEGEKSEFSTSRTRASQLRANGLIEYVDASDAKDIHGDKEKEFQHRDNLVADQAKEFEKAKSTPLKAPSMRMKTVNEKDEKGA